MISEEPAQENKRDRINLLTTDTVSPLLQPQNKLFRTCKCDSLDDCILAKEETLTLVPCAK